MGFVYRWAAASAFVCAAFAWVPPLVDRSGLASLGLAFLALAVGRVVGVTRPAPFPLYEAPPEGDDADLDGLLADIRGRIGAYADTPANGPSADPR